MEQEAKRKAREAAMQQQQEHARAAQEHKRRVAFEEQEALQRERDRRIEEHLAMEHAKVDLKRKQDDFCRKLKDAAFTTRTNEQLSELFERSLLELEQIVYGVHMFIGQIMASGEEIHFIHASPNCMSIVQDQILQMNNGVHFEALQKRVPFHIHDVSESSSVVWFTQQVNTTCGGLYIFPCIGLRVNDVSHTLTFDMSHLNKRADNELLIFMQTVAYLLQHIIRNVQLQQTLASITARGNLLFNNHMKRMFQQGAFLILQSIRHAQRAYGAQFFEDKKELHYVAGMQMDELALWNEQEIFESVLDGPCGGKMLDASQSKMFNAAFTHQISTMLCPKPNNVQEYFDEQELPRNTLIVPLISGNDAIGIIAIDVHTYAPLSDEEQALILRISQAVGEQLAAISYRNYLTNQLQNAIEWLCQIADIANVYAGIVDSQGAMRYIATSVGQEFVRAITLEPNDGPTFVAINTISSVYIADIAKEKFLHMFSDKSEKRGAYFAVPITNEHNTVIAVLCVDTIGSNKDLTMDVRFMIERCANILSQTIQQPTHWPLPLAIETLLDSAEKKKQLCFMAHIYHTSKQDFNSLDSKALAELISYKQPPQSILSVVQALFLILGNAPDEAEKWDQCRLLLRKDFVGRIAQFDPTTKHKSTKFTLAKDKLAKSTLESVAKHGSKPASLIFLFIHSALYLRNSAVPLRKASV